MVVYWCGRQIQDGSHGQGEWRKRPFNSVAFAAHWRIKTFVPVRKKE